MAGRFIILELARRDVWSRFASEEVAATSVTFWKCFRWLRKLKHLEGI